MEDEVCITFLWHGRSRADDEKVYEGRYDSTLTDTGRAQVQHRGQAFLSRNIRFDRIISSTLLRAHESAKIIGQLLNVPVETGADWIELDNGPLAGLPREAAAERYPKPDFRNLYEPIYSTSESE